MLILTFNNAEYRRWIIMCEGTFEMMFVCFFCFKMVTKYFLLESTFKTHEGDLRAAGISEE